MLAINIVIQVKTKKIHINSTQQLNDQLKHIHTTNENRIINFFFY